MLLSCTVSSAKSAQEAFKYLADFETTTEWDPGTIETRRISGDGTVGTKYANRTQFNGRETQLTYEVIEFIPDRLIRLRGENATVVAVDTIEVVPSGSGAQVTYTADFRFKGVTKLAIPFLRSAFAKLAVEAEEGLRKALN